MARCGCSGTSSCSCVVQGGSGINVSGSGTGADPYTIDSTATSITGTLTVTDTPTVDLTLAGSGSVTDPYNLSAQAQVAVGDLTDVATGAPASGDTLLWNGTEWVYGPPSSGGGGAVVVTQAPITGDGSTPNPLGVNVAGTWGNAPLNVYGTNTLLGAPVYVDANGQLRSQPLGAQVMASGQARPNQYPGRVIIENGEPWWSDGTTWRPLGPRAEGPLRVEANRWSAAGIALQSGVAASGTAPYAEFHRFGPMVSMYVTSLTWTPSGGALHSDITNKNLLVLPSSMQGAYVNSGMGVGSTGRLTNLYLSSNVSIRRTVTATAVSPTVTNTSSSQTWPQVQTTVVLSWQIAASLDPEEAFAPIRANAASLQRSAELDQLHDLEGAQG